MRIANIYPVSNQELYRDEKYVMILAHLVKKGFYKPENFTKDQYIIMDNGLFEGEQVSTNLQDLIDLAETSGLPIKEIIVPDVINDDEETKRLFKANLSTILKYRSKYTFMFVAQALTYSELRGNILFINQFADEHLKLSVGISKLSPLDRASMQAIQCYKHCKFPIHLLGIKDSFKELNRITSIENVRGCDTSQLAYIVKNEDASEINPWTYSRAKAEERYQRDPKQAAIDLEHDVLDSDALKDLRELFWEDAKSYGVLR